MASPFSWPVLVPSALRAPAPVNLGVRYKIHQKGRSTGLSLAVWSIAILHGFFVLITYEFTKNKSGIIAAAIISALIGIFTGNPIYILIDILCVIGATLFCLDDLEKHNQKTPEEIREQKERKRILRIKAEEDARNFEKALNKFLLGSAFVVIAGGLLLIKFQPISNQTSINQNEIQQQSNITETQKSKEIPRKTTNPNTPMKKQRKINSSPKKHPIESCLEIHDERAMIRCLETTK